MSKKKTEESDGAVIEPSTPAPPPPEDPPTPQVGEVEALRARIAELESAKVAAEGLLEEIEARTKRELAESRREQRDLGAKVRELGEALEARAGTKDEGDTRDLVVVLNPKFKSLTIAGIRFVRGAPTRLQLSKLKQRQIAALKDEALADEPRVRVTERG